MNFNNIFMQIFTLFILILIGYISRKKDLLDEHTTSKLSSLTINIFLPSMIISSMQIDYNHSMINLILKLILVSILMYLFSFIVAYLLKFILDSPNIGIYQYAIIFSNVGFMGYPVVEAVLGKEAIFYTAIFNLPFNLLLITLGRYLLCKDKNNNFISLSNIINPVIVAIFIGLLLFALEIKLLPFINNPIVILGGITTPISMLIIGSMLSDSFSFKFFLNKNLYIISFIRLIFIPLCIYLILKNAIYDNLILSIAIIISSMPAAANTAIMASEYGADTNLASQIVFLTTLFSILTIPLISLLIVK